MQTAGTEQALGFWLIKKLSLMYTCTEYRKDGHEVTGQPVVQHALRINDSNKPQQCFQIHI